MSPQAPRFSDLLALVGRSNAAFSPPLPAPSMEPADITSTAGSPCMTSKMDVKASQKDEVPDIAIQPDATSQLPLHSTTNALGEANASDAPGRDLFTTLPTELLLHIFTYFNGEPSNRILDVHDGRAHDDFLAVSSGLRALALTCRVFRPIAQEVLYRSASVYDQSPTFNGSSLVSLVRTLLDRPALATRMTQLRLWVPDHRAIVTKTHDRKTVYSELPAKQSPLLDRVVNVIRNSALDDTLKVHWENRLMRNFRQSFCGVLLALLPNLTTLNLTVHHTMPSPESRYILLKMFGGNQGIHDINFNAIPGLAKLKHLKVLSHIPIAGVGKLPALQQLSLCIDGDQLLRLDAQVQGSWFRDRYNDYSNINSLEIDCRLELLPGAHSGLVPFFRVLRKMMESFKNLRSLKFIGETADEMYTCGNHQYRALKYIRYRELGTLIKTLETQHATLESLELPGGYWALPRPHFTVSFDKFTRLQKLVVPKVALLVAQKEQWAAEMTSDMFSEAQLQDPTNQELNECFPPSLRRLCVVGADQEVQNWIGLATEVYPQLEVELA